MASMRLLVKSHGEAWWVGGYTTRRPGATASTAHSASATDPP